jgi:hypothetical protein
MNMSIINIIQTTIISIQDSFRIGVRKSILIFCGIVLLLIYPTYYVSANAANWWFYSSFNPFGLDSTNIVIPKTINKIEVKTKDAGSSELVNGEKILMSFLDNSANLTSGYNPLYYKKQVFDNLGNLVLEKTEKSYLLPGQIKYISSTTDNINSTRIVVQILPQSKLVDYNPKSNPLIKDIDIEIRDRTIQDLGETLRIKTTIKNKSNLIIKNVDLTLLIRDTLDSIVGVQMTNIQDFQPGFLQEVSFEYPKPKNKVIRDSLDVRYDINTLDSNVISLKK